MNKILLVNLIDLNCFRIRGKKVYNSEPMCSFVLGWCSLFVFLLNLIHWFWIPCHGQPSLLISWRDSLEILNYAICRSSNICAYQILTKDYLLFPFLHKTVEKKPEIFFPVLCRVQVPELLLFVIKTDPCLIADMAPHTSSLQCVLGHCSVSQ